MDSDPLALLDPARGLSRNDLPAGLAAAGRQTLPIALRKSRRRTCEQPMNFSLTDYLRGLSPERRGSGKPFRRSTAAFSGESQTRDLSLHEWRGLTRRFV